jgi:hypothetical protein
MEVPHEFDVTYPTTFYPDATDSDQAVPIPLRGGEQRRSTYISSLCLL